MIMRFLYLTEQLGIQVYAGCMMLMNSQCHLTKLEITQGGIFSMCLSSRHFCSIFFLFVSYPSDPITNT